MPLEMWHCPHCGAPQAETARCWVCRRSSTTCSTCTHFRRALAGDLGYCGLDGRRRPLTGLEQRGCWESKAAAIEPANPRPSLDEEPHRLRGGRPIVQAYRNDEPATLRDFVPVESVMAGVDTAPEPPRRKARDARATAERGPHDPAATVAPPTFVVEPEPGWDERTTLFGDGEG